MNADELQTSECYDSKSVTTGTRQNQRDLDLESAFSRIRIDQGTRPDAAAGASEVLYGWL